MQEWRTGQTTVALPIEAKCTIYKDLTAFDDKLVNELEAGVIRLVRTAWLLAQIARFKLPYRQHLEELCCNRSSMDISISEQM